jgi:hypothetical protein
MATEILETYTGGLFVRPGRAPLSLYMTSGADPQGKKETESDKTIDFGDGRPNIKH